MNAVYEYVTADNGTVHLALQSELSIKQDDAKTLCGRRVAGWEMGDETIAGIAATCLGCKNKHDEARS